MPASVIMALDISPAIVVPLPVAGVLSVGGLVVIAAIVGPVPITVVSVRRVAVTICGVPV